MPTFSIQRPKGIAESMRTLMSSSAAPGPLDFLAVDRLVAGANREESLAEKARLEVEQAREQQRLQADPAYARRYATTVSGMPGEVAENFERYINGDVVDIHGPTQGGGALAAAPAVRPEVDPSIERAFRAALGSTMANRLATGKTNAQQMTAAGDNIFETATRSAMQAPNLPVPQANQLGQSIRIPAREPFSNIDARGVVTNQETGDAVVANPEIFNRAQEAVRALTGQRNAAAGASGAAAGLSRERAESERTLRPARERNLTQGRPPKARTEAQEARDRAYARRAEASASKAEREEAQRAQQDVAARFRTDPEMRGLKRGRWIAGEGFEVLDKSGKVIGYYD